MGKEYAYYRSYNKTIDTNVPGRTYYGTDMEDSYAENLCAAIECLRNTPYTDIYDQLVAKLVRCFDGIPVKNGMKSLATSTKLCYYPQGIIKNRNGIAIPVEPYVLPGSDAGVAGDVKLDAKEINTRWKRMKGMLEPQFAYRQSRHCLYQLQYAFTEKPPIIRKEAIDRHLMKAQEIITKLESTEQMPEQIALKLIGSLEDAVTRLIPGYYHGYIGFGDSPYVYAGRSENREYVYEMHYMDDDSVRQITGFAKKGSASMERLPELAIPILRKMPHICTARFEIVAGHSISDSVTKYTRLLGPAVKARVEAMGHKPGKNQNSPCLGGMTLFEHQLRNDVSSAVAAHFDLMKSVFDHQCIHEAFKSIPAKSFADMCHASGALVKGYNPEPDLYIRAAKARYLTSFKGCTDLYADVYKIVHELLLDELPDIQDEMNNGLRKLSKINDSLKQADRIPLPPCQGQKGDDAHAQPV